MRALFKFIDLFAGIGGFRIALESLGGTCVFSSEIDPYARETYYNNFNEYPSGDITKILPHEIPFHDVLCAGFPCQPFSIAGKRKGFNDTRGTLFFEIEKILESKRPKAFVLENVAGIVNHDNGKTLKVIEETLERLNYQFAWKLLNAKDYGIPQNRNRWYCIGFDKTYFNITFNDLNKNDFLKNAFNFPQVIPLRFTLNDIIESKSNDNYAITQRARENINKHIDGFFASKRFNEDYELIANDIRPSRCQFRSDGISPCLTAKMGTGGNNIPVIVAQNRKFSERECLKLMGFPEDYKIKEKSYQSYKQIGNSVVVPIVKMLAREIVRLIK